MSGPQPPPARPSPTLVEVAWDHPEAVALRAAMSAETSRRYADVIATGARPTPGLDVDPAAVLVTVLALDPDGDPVGHGALRRLGADPEIKRMYVRPQARGLGVGAAILEHLVRRARELGGRRVLLHTGTRQPEALGLYRSHGFAEVPLFAPYLDVALSVCLVRSLD